MLVVVSNVSGEAERVTLSFKRAGSAKDIISNEKTAVGARGSLCVNVQARAIRLLLVGCTPSRAVN